MAQSFDLKLLDKRTAERYISLGLLDANEWEKHLSSLKDVSDKATPVETSMGDEDDFEEDEEDEDEEAGELE
ncbi:MAG: hypothetical protein WBV82_23780 [Myxococcaceae bacterium]